MTELVNEIKRAHDANPAPWDVRSAMRGRDRVTVLCYGSEVRAKAWLEETRNGTYVFYTDRADLRGYRGQKLCKRIALPGKEPDKLANVSIAAAVAMMGSACLEDEVLLRLVPKRHLTSDGKLPSAGVLKALFDLTLKDLEAGYVGPGYPAVVAQLRTEVMSSYDGLDGVKIGKALDEARKCVKDLISLGVEFGRIRQIWDEENVRQVLES